MLKRILPLGVLAIAFSGPAFAQSAGADPAALLNKANQMNYEEQENAKTAHSRAGDNQALMTYADTIKGDHAANEDAVSALSRQKSIKLESTKSVEDKFSNLKGGDFNAAYLKDQISDHHEALTAFKSAKAQFKSDPDMELYIEETIPVLEAHLKMAQNLKNRLTLNGSENPENNKSNTGGAGESSASAR